MGLVGKARTKGSAPRLCHRKHHVNKILSRASRSFSAIGDPINYGIWSYGVMKKGTKSFGGFIVVTLSAILIIAAIIAAVFYNEVVIPEPETQAFAAGEIYKQGTYYGRSTYGTNVNTASAFVSAINSGSNINLTRDISLTGDNAFFHSGTYTGQIFGNGYTISINKNWTSNANYEKKSNGSSWGGIVGILGSGGAIYDLNVVMTNHVTYASQGAAAIYVGGIVGSLSGGTIDNCTFTLSGSNSRLAALAWSGGSGFFPASGGIAGHVTGGRISNCTVTNEGWIEGGLGSLSGGNLNVGSDDIGASGLVTGTIYASGNFTIDNIVVRGSGNVKNSFYASALGMLWGTSETVSMTNFYNAFTGTYTCDNSGGSAQFVHNSGGGSSSITNYYYVESVTGPTNGTAYAVTNIAARIILNNNQAGRDVYFDPSTGTDYANSISISYSNQTALAAGVNRIRIWYVYGAGGTGSTPIASTNVITGGTTVTFIGLPSAVSTWNSSTSGGYFTSAIDSMDILQMDDLTEYEHGYVDDGYADSISGTALNSSNFYSTLIDKDNISNSPSGAYKLTEDIVIEGFTGKGWSNVTLDGCGHTIYITSAQTGLGGSNIGGIVGKMTGGTIKNLRIVIAEDVTVATTGSREPNDVVAIGIGAVAGQLTGGATIQNVNVVIPEGVRFSNSWRTGSDRALGGIAGEIVGSGHIIGCTVQLDGQMIAESGWPFAAGLAGITEDISGDISGAPSVTFKNNILKGSGQLGGIANNANQPTFCGAITTTQPGSSNAFTVDGFIYNLTNTSPTVGSLNGDDQLTNGTVSSFGYVCQNNDKEGAGTSAGLDPSGVVNYSNIFDYGASMSDDLVYYDDGDGNVYYKIPTTAAISGSVTNLDGSTVTPYFRPGSTDNITLVASAPSSGWGDYYVLKPVSVNGVYSVDDGDHKVVDVAKSSAISNKTIALERYNVVTDFELNLSSSSYIGEPIRVNSVTIHRQGSDAASLTEGYTVTIRRNGSIVESMLESGAYDVTLTFAEGSEYQFYDSALGGVSDISQSKSVTIYVASVTITITFNESSSANRNAEITYGESTPTPVFTIDNSDLNKNQTVLNA